jgi:small GTP-binding protein
VYDSSTVIDDNIKTKIKTKHNRLMTELIHSYVSKVILLGNSSVGKSSILARIMDEPFNEISAPTIGMEFGSTKSVVSDGTGIKLQVWDAAGQDRFRSIVRSYYRGVAAIVLVFDLSNRKSFIDLSYWLQEYTTHRYVDQISERPIIFLVGNKADVIRREVSLDDINDFMVENNITSYRDLSAKVDTDKIKELVDDLAQQIYNRLSEGDQPGIFAVGGYTPAKTTLLSSEKNKTCCLLL